MKEFFRGWRRKAGIVALSLACVVTCLWFRAKVECNGLYFFEARANIVSEHYWLIFVWAPSGNSSARSVIWSSWHDDDPKDDPFGTDHRIIWRTNIAGMHAGAYDEYNIHADARDRVTLIALPHLWLISLLTLLSAYLILWKPRKRDSRPTQS